MNALLNAVTNFVSVIGYLIKDLYVLCLWVGWAITTVIVGCIKGVISLGHCIVLAVLVLVEDFLSFLEDVSEVVERLILSIVDGVSVLFDDIVNSVNFLALTVSTIPSNLANVDMPFRIGSTAVHFMILVKDAIFLLGICIWEMVAWIFIGLSYLNEAPYVACVLLARALDRVVYKVLTTIETEWFRSLCGLCLGYAIYLAAKNTGILPDVSFLTLLRAILRYLRTKSMIAGSFLKARSKDAFLVVISLAQTLKTYCRELVRSAISYTPTKAALEMKLEKQKAAVQCVVCMDRRRDVMILNCRHMLMCRQCALTVAVNTGSCPVCRSPIDNIISVYT